MSADLRPRLVGIASTASIRRALETKAADRDARTVARDLATLDDDTFAAIVRAEIEGTLPPESADVLGHPIICHRWHAALKAELASLQGAFEGKAGPQHRAWRQWAARRKAEILARKTRATHAIQEADRNPTGARWEKPHASKGPRHAAIDRLIAAHPDEFDALLAEEIMLRGERLS